MKNKIFITACFTILLSFKPHCQNNTFSPYSRYGLGEITQSTFAHNSGMGGAYIAMKPDSTMPIFINAGNPASYSLIRLTSLEVGGRHLYTQFTTGNNSIKKWGANFAYGALGFPVGNRGGAVLGIMPFSNVGYETEGTKNNINIGDVVYKYSGSGGLNKAFLGYGIAPFNKRLNKYRKKHLNIPDSVKTKSHSAYMTGEFFNKLLSDVSIGGNVNYIFGNIRHATRIVYPNSILYNNSFRQREMVLGDFTGNFGIQTAISIDSVKSDGKRRALKDKIKLTMGFFMGLNTTMNASYNSVAYNYILNSLGEEVVRDTAVYNIDQKSTITLPLEQGFGIGFKKGERINLVADFAITEWENFKYLGTLQGLKNNYRIGAGINFVPEKYAAGRSAFYKRINYRFGVSYQTGYINIKNTSISDYFVSAGVGIPVGIGRLSSMINLSVQYGIMGTAANQLVKENYLRFNFGFTFSDRWFQKFRYD